MNTLRDDYVYEYISTATTTQITSAPGELHRIIVGETAAGAIQIIDGTSGTTTNLGELVASVTPGSYEFNVKFNEGLRIITAGASKITVVYSTNPTQVT